MSLGYIKGAAMTLHHDSISQLDHGVTVIDTGFMRPGLAAAYLVVENGRAAFVETGTARSTERLLAALGSAELDVGDVDYVIVTHVHLDHAGGAGSLIARLPNARLVVHPRGARHMIDPIELIQGATAVYGEEFIQQNYGSIVAVPAERVVCAPDDHVIELAGRPLRFVDTQGHAKHHFCVWDEASRGVFSGDTFGLAYPELRGDRGQLIFPTTSPVQFDPETMRASIDRLLALNPTWMYLTHYGRFGEPSRLADDLRRDIDIFTEFAKTETGGERHARIRNRLLAHLMERLDAIGCPLDAEAREVALAMDVELNTQGLEVWIDKRNG